MARATHAEPRAGRGAVSFTRLAAELEALRGESRLRRRRMLESPCAAEVLAEGAWRVNFAANDYLGLANHPALAAAAQAGIARWGVGAGASHLVSGHTAAHEALEQELAQFVGMDAALYFSAGYMANLGILPALAGRGDALFADRLNHASLIDAQQLSLATVRRYPHGDLAALTRLLESTPAKDRVIATDAVFSMDGDIAPLAELAELARRYDAWLVVDDAHGLGVLGPQGRGSLAHCGVADPRIVYMGTLGKAAGVHGAFVAGHALFVEWLLQRARTYIFTTAAPPLLAEAVRASIQLMRAGDALRARLAEHIAALRAGLAGTRWQLLPSDTAIQPVIVGTDAAAVELSAALWQRGLWVPAIRPPTVPEGTARLRISLSAAHTAEHLQSLIAALVALQ
ncbi:MAG: 8-amino-7-oxononanoate synthase [Rhodocyclaceae bacterium]|nr:8-amino-7-oxononanoate synthase [Rhodocyclaceae bacterium]